MEEDKVVKKESNFVWGLLGFFVPMAGLILGIVWKDSEPGKAKAALNGFITYLVTMSIFIVLFITMFLLIIFTSIIISGSERETNYKAPTSIYSNRREIKDEKDTDIDEITGYWATSDNTMVLSLNKTKTIKGEEIVLTINGKGISYVSNIKYNSSDLTTNRKNIPYEYDKKNKTLTITLNGKKYYFNKITLQKYYEIESKMSTEKVNTYINTFSDLFSDLF